MTLIVGIRCRDGIVMAADSAATLVAGFEPTIGQQPVHKLHDLAGSGVYAATGAIGAAQQICNSFRKMVAGGGLVHRELVTPEDALAPLAKLVADTLAPLFKAAHSAAPVTGPQLAGQGILCKSLVALPVTMKRIPLLVQFTEAGAPEMATPDLCSVALGCGQPIADPFLALLKRILWKDREPSVAEGRFAAAWTITHVAQTNAGGVALPLQMATLAVNDRGVARVDFIDDMRLEETHQAIKRAEELLQRHILKGEPADSGDEDGAPTADETPAADHAEPTKPTD